MEIINGYIGCTIFLLTVYIFGRIIFQEKKSNKNLYNIISFVTCSIAYSLIVLFLDGALKTILSCSIFILMLKSIFKISYGKGLLAVVIYSIITIIPDLLIMIITTKVFDISKEFIHNNIAGSIIGNLMVSIIMILICLILKKPLKKMINYSLSTSKKIILVSSLALISLAIFFYILINKFRLNNNIWGYLIVIITLIIILFYLFKQKVDNEAISKKYDDLLNIMKNYENDIEEQRTMIHETRNELMTIKSKINDKEKEASIIKYIDSILGDKVSSNMSKYSKFKYLPSNGIKGFFYYKFMEAEKKSIKVSVNISKKIENSFLRNLETKDFKDLVRIIGIYLDNAIEASAESKDKKLGIEMYLIKDDIEIIISNTFENEINIEMLGKEKFSTKGKNHGYGLLLVKHILCSNKLFNSSSEIKNNIYTQKLRIKNSVR